MLPASLHPWKFSLFLLALAPLGSRASHKKCYFPNEQLTSVSTNVTYEACNEVAGAESQCCASDQGCSANGLCVSTTGHYARGGCTDPTFRSPYCVSLCSNSAVGGTSTGESSIHQCANGSWCCGPSTNTTSTCCSSGQGTILQSNIGVDGGDESGMSSTVKVSIGAGIGAAVLISLGIVAFITWRRRKARRRLLDQDRATVLSPTRSDHGLLPFFEGQEFSGEKIDQPRKARLSR